MRGIVARRRGARKPSAQGNGAAGVPKSTPAAPNEWWLSYSAIRSDTTLAMASCVSANGTASRLPGPTRGAW